MEDLIQKILELDSKTKELVQRSEEEIETSREETLKFLNDFELEGHEESKRQALETYERVYQKAKDEVEAIRKENQERLESVEKFYIQNKDSLVREAFALLDLGNEV